MRDAGLATLQIGVEGRLMVNGPGILATAGAGRQAAHHHIRGLVESIGCKGRWIGDIAEPHFGTWEVSDDVVLCLTPPNPAAFTGEGHHLIPAADQLFHHEAADVARGAEHHHAHLFCGTAAEVMAQRHGGRRHGKQANDRRLGENKCPCGVAGRWRPLNPSGCFDGSESAPG